MEKQLLCPNTTSSSEAKYSAPVPFIGLYIAAASLVCFLLILSDVIQGFRLRKRWFPCCFFISEILSDMTEIDEVNLIRSLWVNHPYLKAGVVDYVRLIVISIVFLVLGIHYFVLSGVGYCVCKCVRITGCVHFVGKLKNLTKEETNLQEIEEYNVLLQGSDVWLEERTMTKCLNDMKRWMASSGNQALTPSTLNAHLTQCLSEVFDLIFFVDKKMHFSGTKTKEKFKLAKAMWLGKDFTTIISKMGTRERRARDIITELRKVLGTARLWAEFDLIDRFVRVHGYSVTGEELHGYSTTEEELCEGATEEELCRAIQQLFVDILHIFLSQLPRAIYKHVSECPVEEYQGNVRLALKFLCQVQCLEGKIEWSYPDGCNFSGIITSRLPAESNIITSQPTAESSIIRSSQMSGECAHLAAIEDETQLACNIGCDEITQVE